MSETIMRTTAVIGTKVASSEQVVATGGWMLCLYPPTADRNRRDAAGTSVSGFQTERHQRSYGKLQPVQPGRVWRRGAGSPRGCSSEGGKQQPVNLRSRNHTTWRMQAHECPSRNRRRNIRQRTA